MAALIAAGPGSLIAYAQGFGMIKKSVKLDRRLPAAVHLQASKIAVKVMADNRTNAGVATLLGDNLQTELLKNDRQLSADDVHPDVLVTCKITDLTAPEPQAITRQVVTEKGLKDQQFLEVSGSMRVAYEATDKRSGHTIDAYNVAETYQHEVEGRGGGKFGTKTIDDVGTQFKKLPFHKKSSSEATLDPSQVQTPAQVVQVMIEREVKDIASRLVNTDESVDVLLARGKPLDESDRLAEQGLWSRMAEDLETMTPFPKPEDDAYRLYNLGVAYEAMAYAAKDPKAAKKFLEQAAINYGKAVDFNKSEKYFLEPQTRIETAAAHYKTLEERAAAPSPAPAPRSASVPDAQPPAASPRPAAASRDHSAGVRGSSSIHKASSTSAKAPDTGGSRPLTDQDVIDMAKAGMDEDNLIANIRDAQAVKFDLSTQAQINLVHNGVNGKVLSAMRVRAHRSTP
jgi:hypothetical protein